MRSLTKQQKRMVERYYNKTKEVVIDSATEQEIADINWYETVYQDINRYVWDYASEVKQRNRGL